MTTSDQIFFFFFIFQHTLTNIVNNVPTSMFCVLCVLCVFFFCFFFDAPADVNHFVCSRTNGYLSYIINSLQCLNQIGILNARKEDTHNFCIHCNIEQKKKITRIFIYHRKSICKIGILFRKQTNKQTNLYCNLISIFQFSSLFKHLIDSCCDKKL